jgi:hypothetical protein
MLYIDPNLKQPFTEHLLRDERIVWAGRPRQGLMFTPSDKFLIPFSLFWCGIVAFWIISAVQTSFIFAFFAAPFVLIGFFFLFGRYTLDARTRSKTYYALTNRRALIKIENRQQSFTGIHLTRETNAHLIEQPNQPDDEGTIIFNDSALLFSQQKELKSLASISSLNSRFYRIKDATKVYNEINQIKSAQDKTEE